jgi:putative tricarboxylic transport membrane protein
VAAVTEILAHLATGFGVILTPASLLAALAGLVAGIIVGAIPGLTATMAVAILAPFTFFMEPAVGIPFLLAVFKAAIYAGSIPAITIATPGTAAAAATAIDGHALARRGEARRALEMSLYASVAADLMATVGLILLATWLASVALAFGPPEMVMLYLIALLTIGSVAGRSPAKAALSAGMGLLVASVGLDPMSGQTRFTFGSYELSGGIAFIPLLIGLFALGEVFSEAATRPPERAAVMAMRRGEAALKLAELLRVSPAIGRGTLIGFGVGVLPGIGAEIACWLSYGLARKLSKAPEQFGHGSLEGVAAAEAGNNGACPGDLIPMMVFGIPGDTVTAVLLGAFMAQGLTPGPLLFQRHADLVYGFFAILIVSNVMLLGLGFGAIRLAAFITRIPRAALSPLVVAVALVGAYTVNSAMLDVWVAIVGGVAGYVMRRCALPIPPLVIAMLVAPGLENTLRQSLLLSTDGLGIFVSRPVSGAMVGLVALVLAGLSFGALRRRAMR